MLGKRPTLIPLTKDSIIHARPDGWHYHLRRDCLMLKGDYERLNYETITKTEVAKRRLEPCTCAYEGYDPDILMKKELGASEPE